MKDRNFDTPGIVRNEAVIITITKEICRYNITSSITHLQNLNIDEEFYYVNYKL